MSGRRVRLTVGDEEARARLDAFLARHVPELTRSAWKRRIEEDHVRVNGRAVAKPGFPLAAGMEIDAAVPEPDRATLDGEAIPLEVPYEDEHIAIVEKPAGLVVHPGHGVAHGTLVHGLIGRGMTLAPAGGDRRPGIVHRLDKDTSGLIVVAKTDAAHRALVAMFASREVRKTYAALVWGRPQPAAGRIDAAIGRSRRDPKKMTVGAPRGRAATTIYRTVSTPPGTALLEIDLVTGRTHQIRVHFAARHHPVIGDTTYGGAPWKRMRDPVRRTRLVSFHRLALHASRLAFAHPITGRALSFEAPLPPEFAELIRALGSGA